MRTHHVSQPVGQSMRTGVWEPVMTACRLLAHESGGFSVNWRHVSCPDCLAVAPAVEVSR